MNIIRNRKSIFSAVELSTTYYAIPLDQAIDAFEKDGNLWIYYGLSNFGFDCIDFDRNFFGSAIINDTLYLCDTNGEDLDIDGEKVDPEKALNLFSVEELGEYIQNATPDLIRSKITTYEINIPDLNRGASWLLDHKYDFKDIVDDYDDYKISH